MAGTQQPAPKAWRPAAIEAVKADVKAAIDAAARNGDAAKRLKFILQNIAMLVDELSPSAQVRRFVLIVSALVHHQRHGGLTPRQCTDLIDYGFAILQVSGIKPRTTQASSLYAELCVISSQIYRQNGLFWDAAWDHGMAPFMSPGALPAGAGFLALGLADRALRLGNVALAESYYEQAERGSPPRLRLEKARIGRMRTLRLKGEREAARELADETEKRFELSVDAAREVAWEKLCLDLSPSFDLKAMLAVTGRGQSHYGAAYIVEAWLWTRAVASDVWKKRIVTIRYLARKKSGVKPQALGTVYDLALALERCEDPHAPLGKSLKDLGKHLGRADRILSLDHELLIWVAAARWLARIESHTQAALALGRYKVLSLMLSHGKHPDVLGCAADLLTAPWANGRELESEDFDASA